ncbi:MAG TPA: hypothetical protein VLJ42_03645 [Solirubrobacteraceae bacterium]|nr:hypothetical protein [Solirubrobacteraceae bacterium]
MPNKSQTPAQLPEQLQVPPSNVPTPRSERGAWLLAFLLAALGAGALVAVLSGAIGQSTGAASAALPPPVPAVAVTPAPAPELTEAALGNAHARAGSSTRRRSRARRGAGVSRAARGAHTPIVARRSRAEQQRDYARFIDPAATHISTSWMSGFYPIYAVAQRTFDVNWLLLASIHKQESAFSTNSTTYHGLNFAGCCGGPMQFNVTNGPVTTWQQVQDSYAYGARPAVYGHRTNTHPSIYDDFDAIMAAGRLLGADGARLALDGFAWNAAYSYYGHDATGVTYADQVIGRAISWSQHGFCVNCGLDPAMVAAVHAAYGAPVLGTSATAARRR